MATLFLPVLKADAGWPGGVVGGDRTCLVHVQKLQVVVTKGSGQLGAVQGGSVGGKKAIGAGWRGAGRTPRPQVRRHALRQEGWHITAIQFLGRRASSQVPEYVEEACQGAGSNATGGTSPAAGQDWAPLPAWEDRIKAVEEAQEWSASQLLAYALVIMLDSHCWPGGPGLA